MTATPEDHLENSFSHCIVIHPVVAGRSSATARNPQSRLEEAMGLAQAIDLEVTHSQIVPVQRRRPATLLGSGKVDDIRALLDGAPTRPGLVIVDSSLTPVQHRNLEKAWDAKVLDRTGLILEIFGERAQTKEGRLQVDLAHLTYQRSRLVRSWTHLERQRGGAGFLGGPGERQIESDRRALAEKIDRLKLKIEEVRRTRNLQRVQRKRAPYPVVSLVGYTNAGKSTLFNRMTASKVLAKDMLFATLDPTMRAVTLPTGEKIILSDTVGFISDLPTELVAAFRATLEEVNEADVILHVRDIAHPETDAQKSDVISVLKSINADELTDRPVIEVLNKIDLLDEEDRFAIDAVARLSHERDPGTFDQPVKICLSSLTGEGFQELAALVDKFVTRERVEYKVLVDQSHGAAQAWLHSHGDVIEATEVAGDGQKTIYTVRLSDKNRGQFEKLFPFCAVESADMPAAIGQSA